MVLSKSLSPLEKVVHKKVGDSFPLVVTSITDAAISQSQNRKYKGDDALMN